MLRFNQPVQFDGLGLSTTQSGWHETELTGVWSRDLTATLSFPLDGEVSERGGVLIVECVGSFDNHPDQWLEVEIAGVGSQRVGITDKSIHMLSFAMPPRCDSSVLLRLTSSRLVNVSGPGGDRALGGLIKSIRVVPPKAAAYATCALDALTTDGLIHARLPDTIRSALRIQAMQPGRVFVSIGEDVVWTAVAQDGVFDVPASVAQDARSVSFLARDRDASRIRLSITPAAEAAASDGRHIAAVAGRATFDKVRTAGAGYGQALMTLAHLPGLGAHGPARVLVAQEQEDFFWRVRPSYGASWSLFAFSGRAGHDARGPFRSGKISDGGESQRWASQASASPVLQAGVVQACIRGLESGPDFRAMQFFASLLRITGGLINGDSCADAEVSR